MSFIPNNKEILKLNMKKLISILLLICTLTICFVSCGNNSNEQESGNGNSSNTTDTNSGNTNNGTNTNSGTEDNNDTKYEKIDEMILVGSPFYEGLAFVQYVSYPDTTFCIDKSGNVIFRLNDTFNPFSLEYAKFKNGLCLTPNNYICDSKGNVTRPEDVGVTNFYNVAFDGKYIIADVVVSTFESSSQKMGVMDSSFNWIVEPTEAIYDAFYEETIDALNSSDYYIYHNDYLYHYDSALNLKTGEIINNATIPTTDFISWEELSDKYTTMANTSNIVNGKAAIFFYNEDTNKHYVSVIDKNGNLMYDPSETGIVPYYFQFDGENIVIADSNYGSKIKLESFNSEGVLTSFNTNTLPYTSHSWKLQDGVIVIDYRYYYDISFVPLF